MGFWKEKKILITGGNGFLGKRIIRRLKNDYDVNEDNIRIADIPEYDLRNMEDCKKAVKDIDVVIHLAAKVGGIGFNRDYPGELFFDNAMMCIQMMEAARLAGVKKYTAIGTICAYPKFTKVPFVEEDVWNGYPEETNAPYGIAKKTQLVQSSSYRDQYGFNSIFLLPVNLYGPGDNFDSKSSHVIPALIKKFVDAVNANDPKVEVWGTGEASREFLYMDDAARGIIMATEKYNKSEAVNLGAGFEIKIKDLVSTISSLSGFTGEIIWDKTKPDGQPRRMLDTKKAEQEFGFKSEIDFTEGLKRTIEWYKTTLRSQ